jgi:hypothetical protein
MCEGREVQMKGCVCVYVILVYTSKVEKKIMRIIYVSIPSMCRTIVIHSEFSRKLMFKHQLTFTLSLSNSTLNKRTNT